MSIDQVGLIYLSKELAASLVLNLFSNGNA